MKLIKILVMLLLPSIGMAMDLSSDLKMEIRRKFYLSADDVYHIEVPQEIAPFIFAPFSVRAVLGTAYVPSCFLVDRRDMSKTLELLINDQDGMVPVCYDLSQPEFSKIEGRFYATYAYEIEDPRNEYHPHFQVVMLDEAEFSRCLEDSALEEEILRLVRLERTVSSAARAAIKKIGCTKDVETFKRRQ